MGEGTERGYGDGVSSVTPMSGHKNIMKIGCCLLL